MRVRVAQAGLVARRGRKQRDSPVRLARRGRQLQQLRVHPLVGAGGGVGGGGGRGGGVAISVLDLIIGGSASPGPPPGSGPQLCRGRKDGRHVLGGPPRRAPHGEGQGRHAQRAGRQAGDQGAVRVDGQQPGRGGRAGGGRREGGGGGGAVSRRGARGGGGGLFHRGARGGQHRGPGVPVRPGQAARRRAWRPQRPVPQAPHPVQPPGRPGRPDQGVEGGRVRGRPPPAARDVGSSRRVAVAHRHPGTDGRVHDGRVARHAKGQGGVKGGGHGRRVARPARHAQQGGRAVDGRGEVRTRGGLALALALALALVVRRAAAQVAAPGDDRDGLGHVAHGRAGGQQDAPRAFPSRQEGCKRQGVPRGCGRGRRRAPTIITLTLASFHLAGPQDGLHRAHVPPVPAQDALQGGGRVGRGGGPVGHGGDTGPAQARAARRQRCRRAGRRRRIGRQGSRQGGGGGQDGCRVAQAHGRIPGGQGGPAGEAQDQAQVGGAGRQGEGGGGGRGCGRRGRLLVGGRGGRPARGAVLLARRLRRPLAGLAPAQIMRLHGVAGPLRARPWPGRAQRAACPVWSCPAEHWFAVLTARGGGRGRCLSHSLRKPTRNEKETPPAQRRRQARWWWPACQPAYPHPQDAGRAARREWAPQKGKGQATCGGGSPANLAPTPLAGPGTPRQGALVAGPGRL